jgi:hypothetical protein
LEQPDPRPSERFVPPSRPEQLIEQRLIFASRELERQPRHAGFVDERNDACDQLRIVLDTMKFANEDDVMVAELRHDVVLASL